MTGTARIGQTPGTLTLVGLLAASLAFACGGWSAMGEEPPEELPPIEFDANPPTGFSPYPYMEEPIITEPVEGTVWAVGTEHELVCSPPYDSDTLEGCDPDSKEDHVTVWWGCSGGQFQIPDYGEPLYPFGHIGPTVTWIAPETPGTITFDCTADDDHYDSAQTQDHSREYHDYCIANDMTTEAEPVGVWIVRVDIDIRNSQGGPWAPETDQDGDGIEDEEDIGAFASANLNDTNGDGHPDNDDSHRPVTKNGALGRDEIDLMPIALHRPEPAELTGFVRLVIEAGNIKIWNDPIKTEEITALEFDIADCPTTWYVEARSATELQGIRLRYEVKPTDSTNWFCPDMVSATAIWAECTRELCEDMTADQVNAILAQDPQYTDPGIPQDEQGGGDVLDGVNHYDGTGVKLQDRSNVIVFEFKVTPSSIYDVPDEYGDGQWARPLFDVSRCIEGPMVEWEAGGGGPQIVEHTLFSQSPFMHHDYDMHPHFPERIGQDNELGNDDPQWFDSTDENDEPTDQGHLWSYDAPGVGPGVYLAAYRFNFREFVRVCTNGGEDPTECHFGVSGSRCSDNRPWYSKTTTGAVAAPNAIGAGNFVFQREALHTETSVAASTPSHVHHAYLKGLEVADAPGPAPENTDILLTENDVAPDADETLEDLDVPVVGKFGETPPGGHPRTPTLVGDQVAYTGDAHFASRLNGCIVGPDGKGNEQKAELAHEMDVSGSNPQSHEQAVDGTAVVLPAPAPGAMVLGEITAVSIDDMLAEADQNGGGDMSVVVELDDYDDWPSASDKLDDFKPPNFTVPREMIDHASRNPCDAVHGGVVRPFDLTGHVASKASGTVIGPDGSSHENAPELCVYVKDVDGAWHHSTAASCTGKVYSPSAASIVGTTPIPIDDFVSVVIPEVYTHATPSAPGQEEIHVQVRDADPLSSQFLETIGVTISWPANCFAGALIGPATPEAGQLSNPAPGGTVIGPEGTTDEQEAEVFYRVKDAEQDIDSPQVSVQAEEP